MDSKRKKDKVSPCTESGFTLVEIVVAFTLLALLMTGLYRVMAVGYSVWNQGQQKIDNQQNLRIASDHIIRELRTAHVLDIGAPGPSILPKSSITMKIPEPEPDQEGNTLHTTIRYYLNGEKILRDVNGAGHNVVASGIRELQFVEDGDSNTVNLVMKGEKGTVLSTKVFVRVNKGE